MAWTENPFSQFPNRYIWPGSFGFGAYCSGVVSVSATQSATLGITRVLEQNTSCHDPPQNPIATRTVSTSDGRLERVWRMSSFILESSMWYCWFNSMMGKSVLQIFWACCTYSRSGAGKNYSTHIGSLQISWYDRYSRYISSIFFLAFFKKKVLLLIRSRRRYPW